MSAKLLKCDHPECDHTFTFDEAVIVVKQVGSQIDKWHFCSKDCEVAFYLNRLRSYGI